MHQLSLEEQKKLCLTDVKEVAYFTEKEIRVLLNNGIKLDIAGENLKINTFNNQSGAFSLVGKVKTIKYLAGGDSIVKRLFK